MNSCYFKVLSMEGSAQGSLIEFLSLNLFPLRGHSGLATSQIKKKMIESEVNHPIINQNK